MQITTSTYKNTALKRFIGLFAYPIFLLLNRPAFARFTQTLYDFSLRANGIAINFSGRHGINRNEERFLRYVAPFLRGRVVVDVGANEGAYSRVAHEVAPSAVIYAFEPHPQTYTRLMARIGSAVQVINAALSDYHGTSRLYDFATADGSTQASLSERAVQFFQEDVVSHEVSVLTLDEFMARENILEIALLKIDAEGSDLLVLKGAARALREKRIHLIQFEFIPANIVTGATMHKFFEVLEGYDIYRLCLNGRLLPLWPYDVKRCEIYVTQNLIAVPAGSHALGRKNKI
jgi:FkbM family methyltransferase